MAPEAPAATAEAFVARLMGLVRPGAPTRADGSFRADEPNEFVAVRMGDVFTLAKEFVDLPLAEIETLLDHPVHEVRVGAMSVMDFQARRKRTPEDRRRGLFELYLRRHDRINNWDLVDRAAPSVVGGYLADKPREVLHRLARSPNVWERRTAIVSTAFFIREGDLDDTFAVAEILVRRRPRPDPEGGRQLAAGGGQEGPGAAQAVPRPPRRDHGARHAALRHRAAGPGGARALPPPHALIRQFV